MISRLRVPLGFVVAAAVLYLAKPTTVSIGFGLPIAITGLLLRLLASGVVRKDSSLATQGPYGWTRNPLYFGSFLLATGFAIMSANVIAAALLLVPFGLIYPRVIRNEEAHLERLFPGEFRLYKTRVPRFIPRIGPMAPSFSIEQYLANGEYNAALGFVAALTVLIVKWTQS